MKIYNSNDNSLITEIKETTPKELKEIISNQKESYKNWKKLSLEERKNQIDSFSKLILENDQKLAELISTEMGKPIKDALNEVRIAANGLESKTEEIKEALKGELMTDKNSFTHVKYDSLGISAVISPWNFPLLMMHNMLIPSLMAGNTAIVKPSEKSSLVAIEYVKLFKSVLPENVLDIVIGTGEIASELTASPEVKLVVFTGSENVGKKIIANTANNLTRVILELGGKDPLIVMEDADLDLASDLAVMNSLRNSGQVCVSTENVFVHKNIANEFKSKVLEKVKEFNVGNSLDENFKLGPMVDKTQKDHVVNQLKNSKYDLIYGEINDDETNVLNPVVIENTDPNSTLFNDETFGPVVALNYYKDEDKLIDLLNSSKYGLGAIVCSKDTSNAMRVAEKLDTGMVGINRRCNGCKGSSWLGAKNSGYSFHGGIDGHRNFAQKRLITHDV